MSAEFGRFGKVAGVQRSAGGVPKLPVEHARASLGGLEGDWQRNRRHHGGPDRALCLYSLELIEALMAEGHAIYPGAIGEKVTITGVDWRRVQPGMRMQIGAAEVEMTAFAMPCQSIAPAFTNGRIVRVSEKVYPGWSRLYSRVVREGETRVGDRVRLIQALI